MIPIAEHADVPMDALSGAGSELTGIHVSRLGMPNLVLVHMKEKLALRMIAIRGSRRIANGCRTGGERARPLEIAGPELT